MADNTEMGDEPDFLLEVLAERHGYTVAELRTERRKGRLKVMRIAGKLRSTDSAIREMRRLCQEEQKALDSISGPPAPTEPPSGSSSTEERKQARDAANATLRALKERLRPTSPTNTSRQKHTASSPERPSPMSSTSTSKRGRES